MISKFRALLSASYTPTHIAESWLYMKRAEITRKTQYPTVIMTEMRYSFSNDNLTYTPKKYSVHWMTLAYRRSPQAGKRVRILLYPDACVGTHAEKQRYSCRSQNAQIRRTQLNWARKYQVYLFTETSAAISLEHSLGWKLGAVSRSICGGEQSSFLSNSKHVSINESKRLALIAGGGT